MCAPATRDGRRSVRAFGAPSSSADRQFCACLLPAGSPPTGAGPAPALDRRAGNVEALDHGTVQHSVDHDAASLAIYAVDGHLDLDMRHNEVVADGPYVHDALVERSSVASSSILGQSFMTASRPSKCATTSGTGCWKCQTTLSANAVGSDASARRMSSTLSPDVDGTRSYCPFWCGPAIAPERLSNVPRVRPDRQISAIG
jgi:hypothetical protein